MPANIQGITHALLRVMTAFLFIPHGYQKAFGLGERGPRDDPMALVAAAIELVGGLLILVGFQVRWTAFVCSGMMAVAYFVAHGSWAASQFLPIINRGELAVLYCFVFLFFWAHGGGPLSVDSLLAKRAK